MDLIDWIRENGGYWNDQAQQIRWESTTTTTTTTTPSSSSRPPLRLPQVYATQFIPANTILATIPWTVMIRPDDPDTDDLCDTIRATQTEVLPLLTTTSSSSTSSSTPTPYAKYLYNRMAQHPIRQPDGWSMEGKELLSTILGEHLPPVERMGGHVHWYGQTCHGDPTVDDELRVALHVVKHRSSGFHQPLKEHVQEIMMPLLDLYTHRGPPYYNVQTSTNVYGENKSINEQTAFWAFVFPASIPDITMMNPTFCTSENINEEELLCQPVNASSASLILEKKDLDTERIVVSDDDDKAHSLTTTEMSSHNNLPTVLVDDDGWPCRQAKTPMRIPCRARGLIDGHNSRTAYLEIPPKAPHGQILICSHPTCARSGKRRRLSLCVCISGF